MSSLRLTVLGCDGSYPSAGGACSGYLVETDTASVWLDAGDGTLARLQNHMTPQDLDAVIVTHSHADHCSNVADLRVLLMCSDRGGSLPVYAPQGVRQALFGDDDPEPYLIWTEVEDGDELEIKDMTVKFSRSDHGPYTVATRIDAHGRTLAYSADTGPNWSMSSLGTDIDLGLIEVAHRVEDEPTGYHLSPRQAGEMAREAQVGKLLLTHIRPDHDRVVIAQQGEAAFGSPVLLAEHGAVYTV